MDSYMRFLSWIIILSNCNYAATYIVSWRHHQQKMEQLSKVRVASNGHTNALIITYILMAEVFLFGFFSFSFLTFEGVE